MPHLELFPSQDDGSASGHGPRQRLLRAADLPDTFTHSLYKVAPYKGCAHGCKYCDGRAERYYFEGIFEKDIEIRGYLPDRLALELPNVRERGMIAFGSGVTDPYQPEEGRQRLMGRCAELLESDMNPGLPALVMTKSALVLRDLAQWKRLNEKAGFILLVSLATLDENLRRAMEPGASPIQERLEALRAFRREGCSVGVLAMPLLPHLSDSRTSICALLEACASIPVDFIMPAGLTLRPGRQKDCYLNALGQYSAQAQQENDPNV